MVKEFKDRKGNILSKGDRVVYASGTKYRITSHVGPITRFSAKTPHMYCEADEIEIPMRGSSERILKL